MANDKKNTNELVADDDDPTAELEALVPQASSVDVELESTASTAGYHKDKVLKDDHDHTITDLRSDLKSRSETINRLQFDMEQLRAKWLGLETEIQAREQMTGSLNHELLDARNSLAREIELIKKRDQKIKALKAEIRQRNDAHLGLQAEFDVLNKYVAASSGDDTQQNAQILVVQAGQLASSELMIRELQDRVVKTEAYADQLRHQIQDRDTATGDDENTREFLQQSLEQANDRLQTLEKHVAEVDESNTKLNADIAALHTTHAEEIRMIRFELGEAEETVAHHELVTEQLASDLVETRGFRLELESMLSESEECSKSRIEDLEKVNGNLRRECDEMRDKLETKSEAINCLLAEFAKKSQRLESIGEIEEVIHEIDDRMSERIDDQGPAERDRVTRVLIGSIDDQELRFPLFKDRLTIGRTQQNDIQLKASHISRRHAVIVTEGDATRVIDWGSKNGVFVNSRRITEHFLKNGDTVTVGTAEFRYEERPKRDP